MLKYQINFYLVHPQKRRRHRKGDTTLVCPKDCLDSWHDITILVMTRYYYKYTGLAKY